MEIARGFRAHGRDGEVVRAARAYLAGLGTTGSLLAGAALIFMVASAQATNTAAGLGLPSGSGLGH